MPGDRGQTTVESTEATIAGGFGQVIRTSSGADGSVTDYFADGTVSHTRPDDSVLILHADGELEAIREDGSRLVGSAARGTLAVQPDGTRTSFSYADGSSFPSLPGKMPFAPHLRPEVNGDHLITDANGASHTFARDGSETVSLSDVTWYRSPNGDVKVFNSSGASWDYSADGSAVVRPHNVITHRTDADGTRWVLDRDGVGMIFAGRPHRETVSADGQTVIREVFGNGFASTPVGQFVKLGAGEWEAVSPTGYLSAFVASSQLQLITETPFHPMQENLIYADELTSLTLVLAEHYVRVANTVVDASPGIGTVKGFVEAALGYNVLGEKLDVEDRLMNLLPIVGKLFDSAKVTADLVSVVNSGSSAASAVEVSKMAARLSDIVDDVDLAWDMKGIVFEAASLFGATPPGAAAIEAGFGLRVYPQQEGLHPWGSGADLAQDTPPPTSGSGETVGPRAQDGAQNQNIAPTIGDPGSALPADLLPPGIMSTAGDLLPAGAPPDHQGENPSADGGLCLPGDMPAQGNEAPNSPQRNPVPDYQGNPEVDPEHSRRSDGPDEGSPG